MRSSETRNQSTSSRVGGSISPRPRNAPRDDLEWEHRYGFKIDQQDFGPTGLHAVVSGTGRPAPLIGVQAQTATARKPAPVPPDTSPLARFVPKENLVVYFEFAGLDSHDAAWKNTASYKMLNETTLGEMLGAVSEQLLDKVVTFIPDHRLSGSEIVTLVKHSARSGWVFALNADPKAPRGYRGTFVLRGGASKENRLLTSRLMGWFMGASKPKVENERRPRV